MITMQPPRTPAPSEPSAYTMYEGGRPIGRVVEPRSTQVLGRGEGTVLLKREPEPKDEQ